MEKQKDTTVVRVSARTPDLLDMIVKKVAVMTDGEVLTKVKALDFVLDKFIEED